MRFLAIDYGTVRVGLAISDELGMIASPFRALPYSRAVVDQIAMIVTEEHVGVVVVGMPYHRVDTESLTFRQARNFAARLREDLGVPVEEWDESFSSRRAGERMIEAGISRKRRTRRETTDTWAAAVILQDYLDAKRLDNSGHQ